MVEEWGDVVMVAECLLDLREARFQRLVIRSDPRRIELPFLSLHPSFIIRDSRHERKVDRQTRFPPPSRAFSRVAKNMEENRDERAGREREKERELDSSRFDFA